MDADNELPELEKFEIEDIVEDYKNIYSAVSLSSAFVKKSPQDSCAIIISEWSQRNLERGTMTRIQRTLLCNSSFSNSTNVNTVDISSWMLSAMSNLGNLRAIVRSGKNLSKNYLEVWNEEKSLMTFDLVSIDLHGKVYNDDLFGSLCWSPQDDKLVYIAEKNPPKTAPFYQQKSVSESDEKSTNILVGEQNLYDDDWGEQMSPKSQSVIAVCDTVDKTIRILDGLPEDICPGHVAWDPSGNGVIGIAIRHKPRRPGIVFCTNRESSIFHLSLDGKYTVLSDNSKAAFSPRFSPDGKYLVWLQRDNSGPHFTVSEVIKYNWETKKTDVLVKIVEDSVLTKNGKVFHGVFTSMFPRRCWSSDSKYIFFNSAQKYRVSSYVVDVDNGNIWDIGSEQDDESISILDVPEGDYIIGSKTSFNQPTALVSLNLRSVFSGENYMWNCLTESVKYEKNLIEQFTVYDLQSKEEQCYATYFGQKSDVNESIPLILCAHGGPHSSIPSQFSPQFHLLSHLGFGILIVHFRGSLGCGKKFVDALPGNIGKMDIHDCKAALESALQKFPWLDKKRVILLGGSHGGFIVTHLSSQYPDDFISTVARNPVTNVATMLYATDIPDWTVVEAGYSYEGMANVSDDPELWKKMVDISPVKNIKNVKTPTLILLGKKDLRVPPFQGLSYYNMLKELKIPTKAYMYDDNHSLSSVPAEMDNVINSIIWFKRCLKRVSK